MEALTVSPRVVGSPVKIRPGKRTALRQAIQIQQRVFEESIEDGVKPSDLAQLARAWDVLEDRKRILRGRPLPGSLKPVRPKPKRCLGPMLPLDMIMASDEDAAPTADESEPLG